MVWQILGTPHQQAIAQAALDRCTFPFHILAPGLRAEVGKNHIPIDWDDLSRYASMLSSQRKAGGHGHIHQGGDSADPIEARNRVLGLAWYSGRVTLDISLERDPTLAGEVLLSEGAHMLDFFWMSNQHRVAIWNALHRPTEHITTDTLVMDGVDLGHDHGWFDVGGYRSWIGEAWMGLFTAAYSDFPVTIPFDHPPTSEAIEKIRRALTPFFTVDGSAVFHDKHGGIVPDSFHVTPPPDRRPCRVCRP